MAKILGVDYSHWQAGVDPQKLIDSGVSFAIVKAGEYVSGYEKRADKDPYYEDDYYVANMRALEKAGIPHGSYFFYHPKVGNSKQLRHFEALYKKCKHDFPPILDCEAEDGMFRWAYDTETAQEIARRIRVMLEGMRDISGRQPIIYTTSTWWSYYAGDPDYGRDYPFWLAQYNVKMDRWTAKIKDNIIMWQFTDKIKISGCPTMDGNWWMGTEEELRQFTNTEITIKKIEENRIKKNIWSLSRANRRWIEENLGRV